MAFMLHGAIGATVSAAPATSPTFSVGTRARLSDGSEWVYLKASATVRQYDCVATQNSTTTQPITSTLGLRGMAVAIAQQAYASGDYGWYLVTNPLGDTAYKVRVALSCAVDAKLATTAFGGTLDDTTAGTVMRCDGIVLTDSQPAGSSGSRTFRTSHAPITWDAV